MERYAQVIKNLSLHPKTWLITGVAGFIGSNLLEALLKLEQRVVGLDNFATGYQRNLDEVRLAVTAEQWRSFRFIEGDIRNLTDCAEACTGVDHVLHQAALGSVPRSIKDPITTNATNIDGFLNILVAARDAGVESFTYAASSSTYGDHPALPKVEENIGKPLSPYAVTKYVNELYAEVFAKTYGFSCVGLRYFNVFGRRQDPNGSYAAVIPKWCSALIRAEPVCINGDGNTSRDFCYIDNVVQANILSANTSLGLQSEVFNVAVGERTSLNELYRMLTLTLSKFVDTAAPEPIYQDFRKGDVRHSLADITKARERLGYEPQFSLKEGLVQAVDWYVKNL